MQLTSNVPPSGKIWFPQKYEVPAGSRHSNPTFIFSSANFWEIGAPPFFPFDLLYSSVYDFFNQRCWQGFIDSKMNCAFGCSVSSKFVFKGFYFLGYTIDTYTG
jgi:hypothetical protein